MRIPTPNKPKKTINDSSEECGKSKLSVSLTSTSEYS